MSRVCCFREGGVRGGLDRDDYLGEWYRCKREYIVFSKVIVMFYFYLFISCYGEFLWYGLRCLLLGVEVCGWDIFVFELELRGLIFRSVLEVD